MKSLQKRYRKLLLAFFLLNNWACSVESEAPVAGNTDPDNSQEFQLTDIKDSYSSISSFSKSSQWGPYNVHDPSIIKVEDWFYSYSTDLAYGHSLVKVGIQIRKSKDLVQWEFVGWTFDGRPQQAVSYIRSKESEPFENIWAPYILQVGTEFRLYYSLSSPGRYTAIEQQAIDGEELIGSWEQIVLGYRVVPGLADEQNSPDHQVSYSINLHGDGTIEGNVENKWTYEYPWITLNYGNGIFTDRVRVFQGYDWENHEETLLYAGLNNEGTAIWGKKK